MGQRATEERQAAFDASFGCMTKDEADASDREIEDGYERMDLQGVLQQD